MNQGRPRFKLDVWTPALTGSFSIGYVQSLLQIQVACSKSGGHFEWGVIPGLSILPVARNRCVLEFLKGDATHFMFLDSDIGVDAQDVVDCVLSGLEFTALPYSCRAFDPERAISVIRNTPGMAASSLSSVISQPAFYFNGSAQKPVEKSIFDRGFVDCERVGTGAMILKRSVFEKLDPLVDEYVDLMNERTEPMKTKNYFGYSRKDGVFIGEDWTFCDLWTSLGERIYLKINAKTSHEGSIKYGYDFAAFQDIADKAK